MTTRLAPDSPKLEMDGKVQPGDDKLSDSDWEDLDNPGQDEKAQENLTKIAKARRQPRASGAKG
jgi:hypothetical protein